MIRLNAVLGKELTTRMRGWRSPAVITIYLVIMALVSLAVLTYSPTPRSYSDSARLGITLFSILSGFQMTLIAFITPASTADAISGERQRQTLDLLLVTRLSSLSIVVGKLVAGLAFNILLLLCSLPLFSLVFLFGGVSPDQFVAMFLVFLGATLLLGSMSLFISTMMRRSGAAVVVSMLCTQGIIVGLGLLSIYLSTLALGSGNTLSIPVTAYFDPLVGLLAALADNTPLSNIPYFTAGPLHLSLWGDQVVADILLSALFILASVAMLRPRESPRQNRDPRHNEAPATAAVVATGEESQAARTEVKV